MLKAREEGRSRTIWCIFMSLDKETTLGLGEVGWLHVDIREVLYPRRLDIFAP